MTRDDYKKIGSMTDDQLKPLTCVELSSITKTLAERDALEAGKHKLIADHQAALKAASEQAEIDKQAAIEAATQPLLARIAELSIDPAAAEREKMKRKNEIRDKLKKG